MFSMESLPSSTRTSDKKLSLIPVIAITYIIFTLNPITGAMEFGVGPGFDLILAGIVLRLYRLVAYDE